MELKKACQNLEWKKTYSVINIYASETLSKGLMLSV